MKFKCTEYNGKPYEWKYTLSKPFGNGFFYKSYIYFYIK